MPSRRTIAFVAALSCSLATAGTALAASSAPRHAFPEYTFAVIGDVPYGDAEIAKFPGRIDQINADPAVRLVAHLGDIKSGSSLCSDDYFSFVSQQFARFADPLVYTPGDNEWTDCHRPNNGAYDPLERLQAVRTTFFPTPGTTLGQHPAKITSQAEQGYPENVAFERARVAFAALHIVGSNDSLAPWTGQTAPTPEQTAEVLGRTAADIALIHDTFRAARHRDRAVVLMTQADMFDPTVPDPSFAANFGFAPLVAAIAQESADFDGPVYLMNGDSHVANTDQPLAAGSPWLGLYGLSAAVPNLHRVTVEGSTQLDEYLRVVIDKHDPQVLQFERVAYTD